MYLLSHKSTDIQQNISTAVCTNFTIQKTTKNFCQLHTLFFTAISKEKKLRHRNMQFIILGCMTFQYSSSAIKQLLKIIAHRQKKINYIEKVINLRYNMFLNTASFRWKIFSFILDILTCYLAKYLRPQVYRYNLPLSLVS